MKAKKKIKRGETGSVKVDPDLLYTAKKLCVTSGIKLSVFVNGALHDKILTSQTNK
jgi:hypothetical protein